MHTFFEELVASLEPSFRRLMAMAPVRIRDLTKTTPSAGIYLLSEGDEHLYVGRSNNIRARLGRHSRPSSTHRMAAFAFRLAREASGHLQASYKKEGSRAQLMEDPTFKREFDAAKARICEMEVRVVAEPDSVRQTILEVYVATALETPYNDFDNH